MPVAARRTFHVSYAASCLMELTTCYGRRAAEALRYHAERGNEIMACSSLIAAALVDRAGSAGTACRMGCKDDSSLCDDSCCPETGRLLRILRSVRELR